VTLQSSRNSIGTVDRALHGRSGVSARTKARVLRMPTTRLQAQHCCQKSLSSTATFESRPCFPRDRSFFRSSARGYSSCPGRSSGHTTHARFHHFPRLGSGEAVALESAAARSTTGFSSRPDAPANWVQLFTASWGRGFPCFASPAMRRTAAASVCHVDAYISARSQRNCCRTSCKLYSRVATITGDLATSTCGETSWLCRDPRDALLRTSPFFPSSNPTKARRMPTANPSRCEGQNAPRCDLHQHGK